MFLNSFFVFPFIPFIPQNRIDPLQVKAPKITPFPGKP